MFGVKEAVVSKIINVLDKYIEIEKACIFGSRSRGDYKKSSDIDLAIFAVNMSSTKLNLLRSDLYDLDIIYTVDVVDFYRVTKEALKENIIKEGIFIK